MIARRSRLLHRHARLAAALQIGDVERVFVGERSLDARPGAHIGAHLLAHVASQRIGGEGQDGDGPIGHGRCLEGGKLHHQGRRIGEIEHPGAARPPGDQDPDDVLERLVGDLVQGPGRRIRADALAPVTLDQALHRHEEVGPHRLRAHVAAPHTPGHRVHEEQDEGGQDEQAGDVVEFLRPDLQEEEIEAPRGEVDQHRLAGRIRPAIPAHEGQEIVDAQRDDEHDPLDAAEPPVDALRVDLLAGLIKRDVVDVRHRIGRDRGRLGGAGGLGLGWQRSHGSVAEVGPHRATAKGLGRMVRSRTPFERPPRGGTHRPARLARRSVRLVPVRISLPHRLRILKSGGAMP